MVLSIIAYSLSASCAKWLKRLAQTPVTAEAAKTPMDIFPIAKARGHIPPGKPGPVPIQHRFNKQPVVLSRHPCTAYPPRQFILDPLSLVIL